MIRNLPNLLTAIRLVLAPIVAWVILGGDFRTATVLVFAAGCTDALDGYLARRFNWTSPTGAYLDPLADKAFLVLGYLALGAQGAVPSWIVWLIMVRDVLILSMVGIAFAFTNVRKFPPSQLGKISTVVQILAALAVILVRSWGHSLFQPVELPLLFAAAFMTALSGGHYLWRGVSQCPSAFAERKPAGRS